MIVMYCVFQDLRHTHEILKNIFLLFPNYCLGRGLMDIAFNEYQNQYYFKTGLVFIHSTCSSQSILIINKTYSAQYLTYCYLVLSQ